MNNWAKWSSSWPRKDFHSLLLPSCNSKINLRLYVSTKALRTKHRENKYTIQYYTKTSPCLASWLVEPCPNIILPMFFEVSIRDNVVMPHHRLPVKIKTKITTSTFKFPFKYLAQHNYVVLLVNNHLYIKLARGCDTQTIEEKTSYDITLIG